MQRSGTGENVLGRWAGPQEQEARVGLGKSEEDSGLGGVSGSPTSVMWARNAC